MRREQKKKLTAQDLRAAGVTPQLVRRRIPLRPGPNAHAHQDKEEAVLPYNTGQRGVAPGEQSMQRDRELLERNRVSCGLPPLAPEQIERWGLQETRTPGEGSR